MRRPVFVASLIGLLSGACLALPASAAANFLAQDAHSPNARDARTIYWIMLVLAVILVAAINAGLIIAVMRFRARRGGEPSRIQSGRGVQRRVAAALAVLAIAVFVVGVVFTEQVREAPSASASAPATEPLTINVIGQRWLWRFEYPGGRPGDRTFSYEELVVPVDTTVTLNITSTDILHRWSVPALGGKVDAVPGQHQVTWFRADQEGVYQGQSAAFSGPSYPTMRATVRVVSPEAYTAYVDQLHKDLGVAQDAVQAAVEAAAAAEQTAHAAGGGK